VVCPASQWQKTPQAEGLLHEGFVERDLHEKVIAAKEESDGL
jgi:hypothetical protein